MMIETRSRDRTIFLGNNNQTIFSGEQMDSQTKLLTSRASLELHYQDGKSMLAAYRDVDNLLEGLRQQGSITRPEMSRLKQINEELYLEFSGG
jgi:hypothetical protein